jgi:hypothetical protein
MEETEPLWAHPELKKLLAEATRALARLDASRLEELVLSCRALNRALTPLDPGQRALLVRQAREASADMAVFGRVLEATRANLEVMNRLRELRQGRLEYSAAEGRKWAGTESAYGDN